jgi:ribosome-binding factor A
MTSRRAQDIKRAQKESFLFREVSANLMRLFAEKDEFKTLTPTRVKLSPDKGRVTIFFVSSKGEADFDEKLGLLILYKPSLRSVLAAALQSRYTPDLTFKYDLSMEKSRKVDDLIDKLKESGRL